VFRLGELVPEFEKGIHDGLSVIYQLQNVVLFAHTVDRSPE
jgi:hypothetical protein